MMQIKTVLTTILLASILLAPIGTAVAGSEQVIGQPNISISTPENEVSPGQRTTLDLYLTNDGSLAQSGDAEWVDRVTTARATSLDALSGDSPIEVHTNTIPAGSVPTGTNGPYGLSITVPEGTAPGTYRLPVRLRYSYTSIVTYGDGRPEFDESFRSRRTTVALRVVSEPRFDVEETTSSAQIGDEGRVAVTIRNTGSEPASEAAVTIESQSDEVTFGTGSQRSESFHGEWAPGETKTATYAIKTSDDALRRSYSLTTLVEYTDADGISGSSAPMRTSVRPEPAQAFDLSSLDVSLRVGEDGRLTGTVDNDGPEPVANAVIRFGSSNPNVNVESREFAIGYLGVDEAADFRYDVTVSEAASASTQQLNFTVRYRNEQGDARTSDPLERTVSIEPHRDRFSIAAVNRTVVVGNTTTFDVRITNDGEEPLQNVEAKAFLQDPLSSDDDEGLIPDLDPGETETITIGLGASRGALEKTYPLSIDFQYEMPDGDTEVSQSYTVPVDVRSAPSEGPPMQLIVGAGVLVMLVLGGWLWRRRE
jgi:uncharacterized repeat protein (TIGR01451 family)